MPLYPDAFLTSEPPPRLTVCCVHFRDALPRSMLSSQRHLIKSGLNLTLLSRSAPALPTATTAASTNATTSTTTSTTNTYTTTNASTWGPHAKDSSTMDWGFKSATVWIPTWGEGLGLLAPHAGGVWRERSGYILEGLCVESCCVVPSVWAVPHTTWNKRVPSEL